MPCSRASSKAQAQARLRRVVAIILTDGMIQLIRSVFRRWTLKRLFFLVLFVVLFTLGPVSACQAQALGVDISCPAAYCVAVSCSSSGCFGQVSVCTCNGPSIGYKCRWFGTITCCNDSYSQYDDDLNVPCRQPLVAARLGDKSVAAERVYVPTCAGGYVPNSTALLSSSDESDHY